MLWPYMAGIQDNKLIVFFLLFFLLPWFHGLHAFICRKVDWILGMRPNSPLSNYYCWLTPKRLTHSHHPAHIRKCQQCTPEMFYGVISTQNFYMYLVLQICYIDLSNYTTNYCSQFFCPQMVVQLASYPRPCGQDTRLWLHQKQVAAASDHEIQ